MLNPMKGDFRKQVTQHQITHVIGKVIEPELGLVFNQIGGVQELNEKPDNQKIVHLLAWAVANPFAQNGNEEMIRTLLYGGADVGLKGDDGKLPLDLAQEEQHRREVAGVQRVVHPRIGEPRVLLRLVPAARVEQRAQIPEAEVPGDPRHQSIIPTRGTLRGGEERPQLQLTDADPRADGGEAEVVKRAETIDDVWARDTVPERVRTEPRTTSPTAP